MFCGVCVCTCVCVYVCVGGVGWVGDGWVDGWLALHTTMLQFLDLAFHPPLTGGLHFVPLCYHSLSLLTARPLLGCLDFVPFCYRFLTLLSVREGV